MRNQKISILEGMIMSSNSRRDFTKKLASGIACVPITFLAVSSSRADTGPVVDENSAQAQSFNYKSISTDENQACYACELYQGGANEFGPCPLFAGHVVAAVGWCNAFVPVSQ